MKVLGAAGAHAAGAAAEGAIYSGVGSTLTEYALGDPSLNAEKILANFGYGALLGGGAGAALKAAEVGVPASVKAASEGVVKLRNFLIGTGEKDAGLAGQMFPSSSVTEALSNRMINVSPEAQRTLLKDTTKQLSEVNHNVTTSFKNLAKDLMPKEAEILEGDALARFKAHQADVAKFGEFISEGKKPTQFQRDFMTQVGKRWEFDPAKIESTLKGQNTLSGEKKIQRLNEYFDFVKQLPDSFAQTYENVPNSRFESSKLREMIDNSGRSLEESTQRYFKAIHGEKAGLGLSDLATGYIAAHNPLFGAAIKGYRILTKPIEEMNKLAEMERMIGKTSVAIGKGAKALFTPSVKATQLASPAIFSVDKHKQTAKDMAHYKAEPLALMEKLSKGTEPFAMVAPDTASAMSMAMMRTADFLSSKIPPGMHDPNPFSSPYEPSMSEISSFERFHSVAEDPLIAFDQVRDGTIVPETIETLSAIYPKLYDEMKQSVLEQAMKTVEDGPIPFQLKQSLSTFLGSPLDNHMNAQSIQMNQAMYMPLPAAMDGGPQPKSSKSGMEKLGVADRFDTDQRSEES